MTHVAFLRAINVGGHGVIRMDDLRAAFERAGGRDVRTFIQSGNVLFAASPREASGIAKRAAVDAARVTGSVPDVMVRSAAE